LIAVVVGAVCLAVCAVQGTLGLQSTNGQLPLITGLWRAFVSLDSSRRRWECALMMLIPLRTALTDKMGWHFRPASAARKGISGLIDTINP
jgi:hypothetical protein